MQKFITWIYSVLNLLKYFHVVSIDFRTPKHSHRLFIYFTYSYNMLTSSHTTTKMTYSSVYTRWSTLKKINNNKICICRILPTLTYDATYAQQNMVIFESAGMRRMSEDYIVLCDDTHSRLTRIANKFIAWIKHIEISQVFMLLYLNWPALHTFYELCVVALKLFRR